MEPSNLPNGHRKLFYEALHPVRDLVLRHLAQIDPLKTLTLSRYHYRCTISILYHTITISNKLLVCIMNGPEAQKRARKACSYTRVLRIPTLDSIAAFNCFRLPDFCVQPVYDPQTMYRRRITVVFFPNIVCLVYHWEVIRFKFITQLLQCYPANRITDSIIDQSGMTATELVVELKQKEHDTMSLVDEIEMMVWRHTPRLLTLVISVNMFKIQDCLDIITVFPQKWSHPPMRVKIILLLGDGQDKDQHDDLYLETAVTAMYDMAKFRLQETDNFSAIRISEDKFAFCWIEKIIFRIPYAQRVKKELIKRCQDEPELLRIVEDICEITELDKTLLDEYDLLTKYER
ncbi:hypothetical protein L204_103056 [Cryptococcus depauperatus]|nr:hypothetical protein L204_00195 [Cryptococcus depauperatus CBS 7855]